MTSTVVVMTSLILVLTLLSLASARTNYQPIAFNMHAAPTLEGPLSSNYAFYNAEKLHTNRLRGPSEFAFLNGNVYTVTIDGKVVNVATCKPTLVSDLKPKICRSIASCGVLTSIRVDRNMTGMLLVLDAYRGVFRVDPKKGVFQHLYKNNKRIAGRVPLYLTDFVQSADGTILMSDASQKYDITKEIYIVMEGRPSGRIISYVPKTKKINLLVSDVLYFPTGLEFTKNEDEVLVTEAGRAVVRSIGVRAHNFRNITLFASNLPGLPTSIRRSNRDTYWVSTFLARFKGKNSLTDIFAKHPGVRLNLMKNYPLNRLAAFYHSTNRHGVAVELNNQGAVIGSLHDPTGNVVSDVTTTVEHDGLLYFSSKGRNFVGRIVLPQGDGRVVTIDSAIEVLRSRCQIPEENLTTAKTVLIEYINKQTGQAKAGEVAAALIQKPTSQPSANQPGSVQPTRPSDPNQPTQSAASPTGGLPPI